MGIDVNGKMASDEQDLCTSYPDFAVICSFIENFGETIALNLPNIEEFQKILEDTENVSDQLIQTVVQLLRRLNKSVQLDKWERALQKYAHTYSNQDGWELERFGFKQAKLEVKVRVVKNLMESQFDSKKFKDKVNLLNANELRLQPHGRDKHGVSYWCQLDEQANLRIYSDDQDEESWSLIARNREELVALIQKLESESPPCASREMSVEGSLSGATTPIGLSNAPTPVDSTAPTPVASGRTSPVVDTGQEPDTVKLQVKPEKEMDVESNEKDEGAKMEIDNKVSVPKCEEENVIGAKKDENSLERRVIKSLEEKGMTLKKEQEDIKDEIKDEIIDALSEDISTVKDKLETKSNKKSVEDDMSVSDADIKENKAKDESCDKKQPIIRSKANSDTDKSKTLSTENGKETSVAKESEKKESPNG